MFVGGSTARLALHSSLAVAGAIMLGALYPGSAATASPVMRPAVSVAGPLGSARLDPVNPDPDADTNGPDDSNAVDPAPKAPSSGTGAGCDNAGAKCAGSEAGTNLDSNNDEV